MTNLTAPPMIVQNGNIINRQTIQINGTKKFTYPNVTSATNGIPTPATGTASTGTSVTGGWSTGISGNISVGSTGDFIFDYGTGTNTLSPKKKKELKRIQNQIPFIGNEKNYNTILYLIKRIFIKMDAGGSYSPNDALDKNRRRVKMLFKMLNVNKVIKDFNLFEKHFKSNMGDFLPKLDIESEIVKLFVKNYIEGLSHQLDVIGNINIGIVVMDDFITTDAYDININNIEMCEYGFIQFTHKVSGNVIEFVIKHDGFEHTVDFFDTHSMKSCEKYRIVMNDEIINRIFEEYANYMN